MQNQKQGIAYRQEHRQTMKLAPRQLHSLNMLAMSLPQLRAEIAREISENPAIEDVDSPLETPLSSVERERVKPSSADETDYPDEDFEPGGSYDEEAAERRQAFFDNQVGEETLQRHLLAQLPLSDIPREDWPLAEMLIGDLDDNGYYKGSAADAAMAFGRPEKAVDAILGQIAEFDPPGCGARNVRECLLAQLDAIGDERLRDLAGRLIDRHLDDLAAGRTAETAAALGIGADEFARAVRALRSLDGRPGSRWPSERERVEYVNPEIHAKKVDGRWVALTDSRSLPEIRKSMRFEAMLKDPGVADDVKAYVKERIAAADAFREAVGKRQRTVQAIAQAIFDRQQDFFSSGFKALKPLTEQEIAARVKVHATTVSRTVRDKYAATPFGTVELRRFFSTAVQTGAGESVSRDAVLAALKAIVAQEDASNPLADEGIAAKLKERGFAIARRTVAKYRDRLKIPGAAARRMRK